MSKILDLDTIESLKELGGDEFISELVILFLDQSEELYKNINSAVKEKNADLLNKAAHKLKGSCLNLGAQKLSEISQVLETKGKSADLTGVEEMFTEFDSIYKESYLEISKLK